MIERMRRRIPKPKKRARSHDLDGKCHKIRYRSDISAEAAAQEHGEPFSPYWCEKCGFFHLTSSPRSYRNYAMRNITIIRRPRHEEEG